jgi:hypothetical protein
MRWTDSSRERTGQGLQALDSKKSVRVVLTLRLDASVTMAVMVPTIPLPGSDDVLELVPTADGFGYTACISRRHNDGSLVWTALPPRDDLQDAWVAVRVDGQDVIANSWSAFEARLDLETGEEIARQFTK